LPGIRAAELGGHPAERRSKRHPPTVEIAALLD